MNEIVALYKFVNVANPTDVQKRLKSRLKYLNIYGIKPQRKEKRKINFSH